MGKKTPSSTDDTTTIVENSFTGTGNSASFYFKGSFNIALWGNFVGTVKPQMSFDGGTTWLDITNINTGTAYSFTAPLVALLTQPESGVLTRLTCSAFTSGPINYRLSQ